MDPTNGANTSAITDTHTPARLHQAAQHAKRALGAAENRVTALSPQDQAAFAAEAEGVLEVLSCLTEELEAGTGHPGVQPR